MLCGMLASMPSRQQQQPPHQLQLPMFNAMGGGALLSALSCAPLQSHGAVLSALSCAPLQSHGAVLSAHSSPTRSAVGPLLPQEEAMAAAARGLPSIRDICGLPPAAAAAGPPPVAPGDARLPFWSPLHSGGLSSSPGLSSAGGLSSTGRGGASSSSSDLFFSGAFAGRHLGDGRPSHDLALGGPPSHGLGGVGVRYFGDGRPSQDWAAALGHAGPQDWATALGHVQHPPLAQQHPLAPRGQDAAPEKKIGTANLGRHPLDPTVPWIITDLVAREAMLPAVLQTVAAEPPVGTGDAVGAGLVGQPGAGTGYMRLPSSSWWWGSAREHVHWAGRAEPHDHMAGPEPADRGTSVAPNGRGPRPVRLPQCPRHHTTTLHQTAHHLPWHLHPPWHRATIRPRLCATIPSAGGAGDVPGPVASIPSACGAAVVALCVHPLLHRASIPCCTVRPSPHGTAPLLPLFPTRHCHCFPYSPHGTAPLPRGC